jgi:hypothetical protein
MPTPYEAKFPVGSSVRVKDRASLEQFARTWKLHDPLTSDQLEYANKAATVEDIGYYHGGDPLYKLSGVSGVWHESCLEAP